MRTTFEILKSIFTDKNGSIVSIENIEEGLDFTREQYEQIREKCDNEILDFDDFLKNVSDTTYENGGTLEDTIFMANDAFYNLK